MKILVLLLFISCSKLPIPGDCYNNTIMTLKIDELFKNEGSDNLSIRFKILETSLEFYGVKETTIEWFNLNNFQKVTCPIIIKKEK